jgi:hypothetical protein
MKTNPLIGLMTLCLCALSLAAEPEITPLRTPEGGIQPVAETSRNGAVHLLFFKGDPGGGDLFHTVREAGAKHFASPVRVNSRDGSALAIGTIRGAQMALGRDGHVHVAWMGSGAVTPEGDHHRAPMLYARSTDGGKSFEAERNLITKAFGLDGGGAIAADQNGKVCVFWHAGEKGKGEAVRKIWVSRSSDDGKTFAAEVPAWQNDTGVCGCCGMTAGASADQTWIMYRSATAKINRDIYLLRSDDKSVGSLFTGEKLDQWELEACPMSAMSLAFAGKTTVAAWEAAGGDLAFSIAGSEIAGRVAKADKLRKFPDVAISPEGYVLLAWVEGGGWNTRGQLGWQLFDPKGNALGTPSLADPTETWTKPAAVFADGRFYILY